MHTAPSTPGDLLFHLRAEREDMTFELERQLLDVIGDAARVVDETVGFRYFDARDLLGFVDGTANPTGAELPDAALIGADADPDFAGGSYVVVQKYLHDMAGWAALSTEEQEAIIGRTKLDNVELDDDDAPRKSHKSLATIEDAAGGELAILRDNMPFGRPGAGEFGTYFIGYAGRLWVIEQMLERMFVGAPAGAYDRLLDFSTAITGTTFFVPTAAHAGDAGGAAGRSRRWRDVMSSTDPDHGALAPSTARRLAQHRAAHGRGPARPRRPRRLLDVLVRQLAAHAAVRPRVARPLRDRGLVVVGVHAPEFGFEHDLDNVRRAIGELDVRYPVVIDNDFGIWRAFDNHYWPAVYLVDGDGQVRFHHFGEEAYAETEQAIQQLLGIDEALAHVDAGGIAQAADWGASGRPETYVGRARGERRPDAAAGELRSTSGRSRASGRSRTRPGSSRPPAARSPTASRAATSTSCSAAGSGAPVRFTVRSTASRPAPTPGSTSTRPAPAR